MKRKLRAKNSNTKVQRCPHTTHHNKPPVCLLFRHSLDAGRFVHDERHGSGAPTPPLHLRHGSFGLGRRRWRRQRKPRRWARRGCNAECTEATRFHDGARGQNAPGIRRLTRNIECYQKRENRTRQTGAPWCGWSCTASLSCPPSMHACRISWQADGDTARGRGNTRR